MKGALAILMLTPALFEHLSESGMSKQASIGMLGCLDGAAQCPAETDWSVSDRRPLRGEIKLAAVIWSAMFCHRSAIRAWSEQAVVLCLVQ